MVVAVSRYFLADKLVTHITIEQFLSKITVDGDSSPEIRRLLLLGRKGMTHLGSVLKIKDVTLPTKVYIVKAMVFPVDAYRWPKVEKVTDFIFLGFKITEDGDCSHEIRIPFLLERKARINLDSILKGTSLY